VILITQVPVAISVVIPVFNGSPFLARCLDSLKRSKLRPAECIVVDDCSTDDSCAVAEAMGATVIQSERHRGPAAARNLGACHATSDLLVFIDADVCVHRDTLSRIRARFEGEPELDALIGSYDECPAAPGIASQYKNLLNHYVHQHGHSNATTFWSACGAIRREVFLAQGGFDESYGRPAIEDISFGYRLRRAGYRIALDRSVQVKHWKQWTVAELVRCDIFDRALPWTRLMLEYGQIPNDLNVAVVERVCALFAWVSVACLAAVPWYPALLATACVAAAANLAFNRGFFGLLAARRGWPFAAAAVPLHFAYYLYSSLTFAAGTVLYFFVWRWRPALRYSELAERAGGASAQHT